MFMFDCFKSFLLQNSPEPTVFTTDKLSQRLSERCGVSVEFAQLIHHSEKTAQFMNVSGHGVFLDSRYFVDVCRYSVRTFDVTQEPDGCLIHFASIFVQCHPGESCTA